MTEVTAIIVAAGEGRRIGGEVPKTYLLIAGRPMLLRTLDRFYSASIIGKVILVVAANELSRCEELLRRDSKLADRSWVLQTGGVTRQQSVKRGLESIDADTDIVVIHDGARPLVSPDLISRCIAEVHDKSAVVVGLPVRDTVKIVSEDRWVQTTPPRNSLWEIQTPQAFRKDLIVAAHDWAERQGVVEATDDATLVEQMGEPVFVIEGERTNVKITVPEDVWLAETLIREERVP
jgi:2-C-methyl-D-erythritol 4-phosphate cytidylyltransferase